MLWHSSMNQTGCVILYSRTCVLAHATSSSTNEYDVTD